jgi:hypothetical protein
MSTYRIVRMYQNHPKEKLRLRGLTLAEAQAHCRNPQTSSSTCTTAEGKRRTVLKGPWFEGYEEEPLRGSSLRARASKKAKRMDPLGF